MATLEAGIVESNSHVEQSRPQVAQQVETNRKPEAINQNIQSDSSDATFCLSSLSDDFEKRFQFNMDIPSPSMWKAGPKTYPSQYAWNRNRSGGGRGIERL